MSFQQLVQRCRSYRRFDEQHPVARETLEQLVDLARWSPAGMNRQPLKYVLSADAERNALIFPHLVWAAKLPDWPGPGPGERPTAYIIIVGDRELGGSPGVDHGIAAHSILLGATDLGLGGCMFGSINRPKLQAALGIPDRYDILLAVAIGKPRERIVLEDVPGDADTTYYRDPDGTHHVPKRRRADVIVG